LDRRLGEPQSRSEQRGGEKILAPHRGSNSDTSVVQSAASCYTDYDIAAFNVGEAFNLEH
jgi:hypothetical protein